MLRYLFILLISFNTHAICLDHLKTLVESRASYRFSQFTESEAGSLKRLVVRGYIGGSDTERGLASFDYMISRDRKEISVDLMSTHQGLQGLGLQTLLFEELLRKYPDVQRFTSILVETNEDVMTRKLIENLIKEDAPVKGFNPLDPLYKQLEDCCGDFFMGLDEQTRIEYIKTALKNTPYFKTAERLGLRLCEQDPLGVSYARRLGDFSIVVEPAFCR